MTEKWDSLLRSIEDGIAETGVKLEPCLSVIAEGADEVERLKADNAQLRADLAAVRDTLRLTGTEEERRLREEVERLKARVERAERERNAAAPVRIVIDRKTAITHVFYAEQDARDWLVAQTPTPLGEESQFLVSAVIRVHATPGAVPWAGARAGREAYRQKAIEMGLDPLPPTYDELDEDAKDDWNRIAVAIVQAWEKEREFND